MIFIFTGSEKKVNKEEKVIELATSVVNRMRGPRRKALQPGSRPWHEEVSEIWADMTTYERAWYILFISATLFHSWDSLRVLADTEETYTSVYTKIYKANNAYNIDIVNITYDKWLDTMEKLKTINEERIRNPVEVRGSNYSPNDIPDDLGRLIGNKKDLAFPLNHSIRIPSYDKPTSSPVKKVSSDEYLATRRTAPRLGVRLEFDKERTQVYNNQADKDDRAPGWYRPPED
jgi:hypothetical protein